jgi:hypothetical protein
VIELEEKKIENIETLEEEEAKMKWPELVLKQSNSLMKKILEVKFKKQKVS